jgi:hypothetical protein
MNNPGRFYLFWTRLTSLRTVTLGRTFHLAAEARRATRIVSDLRHGSSPAGRGLGGSGRQSVSPNSDSIRGGTGPREQTRGNTIPYHFEIVTKSTVAQNMLQRRWPGALCPGAFPFVHQSERL